MPKTPVFPHGIYGIFISQGAKIGKKLCYISAGNNWVKYLEKRALKIGAPMIGDNVYIGAGAKIIGKS